jgi:hypothetical protein
MVSRRGAVALVVLVAWLGGLALFARRELTRAPAQRLAEAALRVAPGGMFYVVSQGASQIGFARSTIDTVPGGITVDDYLVVDLPVGGRTHRTTAQSSAKLTRGLAVREFVLAFESDSTSLTVRGRTFGDSLLEFAIAQGSEAPDTQRVPIPGPILLPTLVPLAFVLGERPKVGATYTTSSFDPLAMAPSEVRARVVAESLFTLTDSATYDTDSQRWRMAHRDTVRAWLIESERVQATEGRPAGFRAWVDEQGRIVEVPELLGFELKRTAYEIAFEEWRAKDRRSSVRVADSRDVLETTAISAGRSLEGKRVDRLTVRLRNAPLVGYDLDGGTQTLSGDTLSITRASVPSSVPYALPAGAGRDRKLNPYLRAEPLLERNHPEVIALARRIAAHDTNPAIVAERIARWVHDSVRKVVTVSVPSALQVLRARAGDCNEHTQLYVALARAAGIPARTAAGLAHIDGTFYYHAWPEVYLGTWVPVDPTFGQFPADAAHLRFVYGGLARQADLVRLMGVLRIDALETR